MLKIGKRQAAGCLKMREIDKLPIAAPLETDALADAANRFPCMEVIAAGAPDGFAVDQRNHIKSNLVVVERLPAPGVGHNFTGTCAPLRIQFVLRLFVSVRAGDEQVDALLVAFVDEPLRQLGDVRMEVFQFTAIYHC